MKTKGLYLVNIHRIDNQKLDTVQTASDDKDYAFGDQTINLAL